MIPKIEMSKKKSMVGENFWSIVMTFENINSKRMLSKNDHFHYQKMKKSSG